MVLPYPGLCDFVGDASFSRIVVHPHPGADERLLPMLITGALLRRRGWSCAQMIERD